jgi:porphobilinogen synthase
MRRLRQADWSRRLVQENVLTVNDLVWAVVVSDTADPTEPVAAMPGVERFGLAALANAAKRAEILGIPAMEIFPHIDPAKKDE